MTTPQKAPTVGVVKWFDFDKGFGFISTYRGDLRLPTLERARRAARGRQREFHGCARERRRSFARKVVKT